MKEPAGGPWKLRTVIDGYVVTRENGARVARPRGEEGSDLEIWASSLEEVERILTLIAEPSEELRLDPPPWYLNYLRWEEGAGTGLVVVPAEARR